MEIQDKVEDIIRVIEKVGELLMQIYRKQDLDIQMKPDATPVTEGDKLSNEILCHEFKKLFPDIPIISEESNTPEYSVRNKWKYAWVIDPLDGTKEFIYKNGRFCINIALLENNIPVFGIINNIRDNEILWAFKNGKCYIRKDGSINEFTPQINQGSKLRMAVSRFNMTEAEFEYIDYLQSKGYVLELIPLGASSKHCEVAKGSIDICPKFGRCYEWDTAASQVIIEASGGAVINAINFAPLEYNKRELVNPPFIMFSKKLQLEIKSGNQVFTSYQQGQTAFM